MERPPDQTAARTDEAAYDNASNTLRRCHHLYLLAKRGHLLTCEGRSWKRIRCKRATALKASRSSLPTTSAEAARDSADGRCPHISMGVPVVKVGRIAGQFAKPRSSDTEIVGDLELPSFRGHIVNDPTTTEPPEFLILTDLFRLSPISINLESRSAFTKGGFAASIVTHGTKSLSHRQEGWRYDNMATEIDRALRFMSAIGIDTDTNSNLREVDVWTSHEALLLGYEESLTRRASTSGNWYDCSAHMLWIGERTREPDGAHVELERREQPDRLQSWPDNDGR